MSTDKLQNKRREYNRFRLDMAELASDPLAQFKSWLAKAEADDLPDYNAMVLSTAGSDMQVHSRNVLLRDILPEGLVFYTNYQSNKGREIEENNKASLLFFWPSHERQIRIEGSIWKAPVSLSDAYFAGRPRESQLAAHASDQSEELSDPQDLQAAFERAEKRFAGKPVSRPEHWGGYIVRSQRWEFWQGQASRLNQRFEYRLDDSSWKIRQLQP
ncbi:MAG: pyridoxamine 5'-phosphate oxidase [Bacteroidales bacterium]